MASSFQERSVDNQTLFDCGSCHAVWIDPVTIKCGHTFCRECLQKDSSRECRCCREVFDKKHEFRTNVLLSAVVEKCFPGVVRLARLKSENKEKLLDGKFSDDISLVSEAGEKGRFHQSIVLLASALYKLVISFIIGDLNFFMQIITHIPLIAKASLLTIKIIICDPLPTMLVSWK